VLIEGAWAYRDPAKVSRHLQWRLATRPKPLQEISWKAHVRLCTRSRQLSARGNHATQVVGAIAREWIACMWAIAQERPLTPETETQVRWDSPHGYQLNQPSSQTGSGASDAQGTQEEAQVKTSATNA
jgi:hypothetical protein